MVQNPALDPQNKADCNTKYVIIGDKTPYNTFVLEALWPWEHPQQQGKYYITPSIIIIIIEGASYKSLLIELAPIFAT